MRFHKRSRRQFDIEAELRRSRPEPDSAFVSALADEIRTTRCRATDHRARSWGWAIRPLLSAGLTAAMCSALAGSGQLSFAATGFDHAITGIEQAIHIGKSGGLAGVPSPSAANDQYRKPPTCQSKAKQREQAEIAAARRLYNERLAAARTKHKASLRACTTLACRRAANKAYERDIAAARRALQLELGHDHIDYRRLLGRCKR